MRGFVSNKGFFGQGFGHTWTRFLAYLDQDFWRTWTRCLAYLDQIFGVPGPGFLAYLDQDFWRTWTRFLAYLDQIFGPDFDQDLYSVQFYWDGEIQCTVPQGQRTYKTY